MNELPPKGYIPAPLSDTDYIKDVNSPLGAAFTYDWRLVRPSLNLQNKNGFETWGCVSWAGVQSVEEYINALIAQSLLPQTHLDFLRENGYLENGIFTASKVFIWITSGTIQGQGNTFANVSAAIRGRGLIPESSLPFNPQVGSKWVDIFNWPTPAQLALGLKFKQYFDIGYHYLVDKSNNALKVSLQEAPIQIAIPTCPGYSTDNPIQACGLSESHSVLIDYVDPLGQKEVVDHYSPEVKILSVSYPVPAAMQYMVTSKAISMSTNQTKIVLGKDGKTVYKCTPIAEDFVNFVKQAGVEGIDVPNPIPLATTL